ncbi:tripartite tricarboxylate transporter substrate binding protein [Cupriavidus plantarum]|uniref:Tripartite-type tricarboxylate transporter receptor subunit TctC n=2 Tax=Cupriavidus plantarum TaxID=942865 RepID=A0A316F025_9BURK|nr:tripartite tricarboxylate transporter substrate binding protein [Cupriavidus plantarum]NYH99850.1 tripartite-type tricarboxylate transporter receptor subunit TctC [Cupriavidus plantarum]PWK37048.1 tripartite-type tricarboxylate transporter receptor subunit TctC [Cupriavidus plantarum]
MRHTPCHTAHSIARGLSTAARLLGLTGLVVLPAVLPIVAHAAETFPNKPVSMLVAFPPGGPADVVARAMQPAMAKVLGQPVVIENLPGAGGALAMQRLLSRPADGYTLIMGSPNEAILTPLALASAKYKSEELALVAPVSNHPLVLMTRNDLPYTSLEQIVAAGKTPGAPSLTFGNPGYGTMYHIVAEYMAKATGAKVLQVPYKGATPMLADLTGHQIDMTILPNIGASTQLLETRKIKAVAVLDNQRMRNLPDVPAIGETQVARKSEFVYSIWIGVMARAGMPADRARVLLDASQQALRSPELVKALALSGVQPLPAQSLETSAKFYADETARFRKMAASVELVPQ